MDCQKIKLVVLSLKHVGDVMILELHYQFGTLSLLIQLLNSSNSSGSGSLLTCRFKLLLYILIINKWSGPALHIIVKVFNNIILHSMISYLPILIDVVLFLLHKKKLWSLVWKVVGHASTIQSSYWSEPTHDNNKVYPET